METLYDMTLAPMIVSGSDREYTLRFRDIPTEKKPRERLVREGPGALSTPELLASILVTGTQKEDVMAMANRIVQEYGEQSALFSTDAKMLAEDLDIPLGKAVQIIACGELGRRFFKRNRNGAPVIRTARDVYEYTIDMRNLTKEHLRGLYLNTHYQLVHDEIISIGTIDANIVHPREVFRPALAHAAAAVILVHNHPSGNVSQQLHEAGKMIGIELIDHIVITADTFTSISTH
jgi:DNA repair protein RadC